MLLRVIKRRLKKKPAPKIPENQEQIAPPPPPEATTYPSMSPDLDKNKAMIQGLVGDSADLKFHEFRFGPDREYKAFLFYVDGLVNVDIITQSILKPLLFNDFFEEECDKPLDIVSIIKEMVLCSGDITESEYLSDHIAHCLSGDTVLLVDGYTKGLIVSTKGWDKRSVTEPQTESVVRGPREGFTENFRTNTALMRRRLKSPQLRMDHMTIGVKTLTDICLVYIDGVAVPKIIEKLKYRLEHLKVDSILDSGYVEEYIEDAPLSIFPTVAYTEKPDVAAAKVLEGRIAILVDGSPFALTVPMLFIESFQTAEDYYGRAIYASIARLTRYFAYFISVFGPAIYVALTSFHQELIPTTLLFTIAAAREGTPFPSFVEALLMVFAFEILREAGLRLPRPVGQAVSIVGALILGDAAVSAGVVGAPMVITIAITAVCGFVVPEQNETSAILRLISLCAAAVLGGYGLALVFLGILVHLASLESFGVPYFAGLLPSRNFQDTFIRMPLWTMTKRPKNLAKGDVTRRHFFIPPLRPHKEEEDGGTTD